MKHNINFKFAYNLLNELMKSTEYNSRVYDLYYPCLNFLIEDDDCTYTRGSDVTLCNSKQKYDSKLLSYSSLYKKIINSNKIMKNNIYDEYASKIINQIEFEYDPFIACDDIYCPSFGEYHGHPEIPAVVSIEIDSDCINFHLDKFKDIVDYKTVIETDIEDLLLLFDMYYDLKMENPTRGLFIALIKTIKNIG